MSIQKKLQYSVFKRETGDAGGKAKCDAFDIVNSLGFKSSYNPSSHRTVRVIQQLLSLRKFDKSDAVFVQYPAVDIKILNKLKKHIKGKCSIALVHDLRSVQFGYKDLSYDLDVLNDFKYVIVHNRYMERYLVENGLKSNVVSLELFDYLHDENRAIQPADPSNSVAFAGNLIKSKFVDLLGGVKGINLKLYGVKSEEQRFDAPNAEYCGCLPSDEIVYALTGAYGLVWDGDAIDCCSGTFGQYLKYNNPHKLSLYISAGKPVITWKKAAIAEFVSKNDIGFAVDSLEELSVLDLSASYSRQRENVLKIKSDIANGRFLKNAINGILSAEESIEK